MSIHRLHRLFKCNYPQYFWPIIPFSLRLMCTLLVKILLKVWREHQEDKKMNKASGLTGKIFQVVGVQLDLTQSLLFTSTLQVISTWKDKVCVVKLWQDDDVKCRCNPPWLTPAHNEDVKLIKHDKHPLIQNVLRGCRRYRIHETLIILKSDVEKNSILQKISFYAWYEAKLMY